MEKHALLTFRQRSIFVIIWGLLFAKCFTLEYMVQKYAVPINAVTYIWLLSISMALVATIFLIHSKLKAPHARLELSRPSLIWSICLIFGISLSAYGFFFAPASAPYILATLGIVLATGYAANGFPARHSAQVFSAVGWFLGALFLFYLGALVNFQIFALLIVVFSVLPAFWDLRRHPQGFT